MAYHFIKSKKMVLEPVRDCSWASEMVLNPSIIEDNKTGRIHMLFRATGPCREKQIWGKPLPYPIFLGYGWSDDHGHSWCFDLDTPALTPKLEYSAEKIFMTNYQGKEVTNYTNGCIEDPRMFYFEGECYVITACRMFPPGPYWEYDDPKQCAPEWANLDKNPFGKVASENVTVNVLFKVDLDKLAQKQYEQAFTYITHLTNAIFGEDRDVLIFPERLNINGKKKMVMIQRPFCPSNYQGVKENISPSMMICAADCFEEFPNPSISRQILAVPEFEWEKNRIGGSATPIKIDENEWLLSYHGKQDSIVGYTQSFMILEEQEEGFPKVKHRCSERLIIADEPWEQPNRFKTPCVFITGLIRVGDRLVASYGAADEKVGVLEIDFKELVKFIRKF